MRDRIFEKIPKLYELGDLTGEALQEAAGALCPNGLHKKVKRRLSAER